MSNSISESRQKSSRGSSTTSCCRRNESTEDFDMFATREPPSGHLNLVSATDVATSTSKPSHYLSSASRLDSSPYHYEAKDVWESLLKHNRLPLEGDMLPRKMTLPEAKTEKSPLWQLSVRGFEVKAHRGDERNSVVVSISSENAPSFTLEFREPLASRTFLFMPGGELILGFSKACEVSVASLNQPHSVSEDEFLTETATLMHDLYDLDDQLYCQTFLGSLSIKGKVETFSIEVGAGRLTATNETLVSISLYKYSKPLPRSGE